MTVRLLVVEDDLVDRLAVRRALKAAGVDASITEVDTVEAGLDALQTGAFDCVLLDYRLPTGDGLELLTLARTLGIRTPFIALTGQGDEQLAAAMMRAGASDYLPKHTLTSDRLERSIRHALELAAAEEERRRLLAREQAARADAQAANHAKDEFLATLSHELRTPLNAILGWARLLANGTLDADKSARAVRTIERNALAQARLIEDMLDLSRVVTGKVVLDVAPLDLPSLVESVVESFRPTATAKSLALTFRSDNAAAEARVMGDIARLQQVLGNLLSNAIKFTPAGGAVGVTLGCEGGSARIVVHDTGIGLDPDFLPHAFERFRQGESGSTRHHGGLGLGLAIVQHMIRLHGGDVMAESEGLNRGATFTVTLPALARETGAAVATAAPGIGFQPSLTDLRILAVDDDPDALALMETVLSQRGAKVTRATSVADALAALERDVPDVLISDIAMPGQDGYALIHAVRTSPRAEVREVPAAALTAYASAEDRTRVVLAGFQSHLPKPIDVDALVVLVAKLAGRPIAPTP